MDKNDKVILDLCGGTGSWSKPYKEAGYDVRIITLPEYDVFEYEPPDNVYGILAAPTCTHFSFARTNAKTPRDLKKVMELVERCLYIIWKCQYKLSKPSAMKTTLNFWALENPRGFLKYFLGNPVHEFQPWQYGDEYMKCTNSQANWCYSSYGGILKYLKKASLNMKKHCLTVSTLGNYRTSPTGTTIIKIAD